jgi:hypothetical protein
MSDPEKPTVLSTSLSLKLGRWIDARATGWGVLVLPVVIALAGFLVLAILQA